MTESLPRAVESTSAEEPSSVWKVLGCLFLPALIALGFFAARIDRPWLTYPTLALGVVYLAFKLRAVLQMPERTAESIVGVKPHAPSAVPEKVLSHLESSGLVNDERVVAALDDSLTDNGSKGVVVTNQRVFAYRGAETRLNVDLRNVAALHVRKMWYPGVDLIGRGEFFGHGPITVLRLRFKMQDGTSQRLRISTYAHHLYPVIDSLIQGLGERFEVRRTIPGL
jgi:hypothetical protein